jgi:hypothetical protein
VQLGSTARPGVRGPDCFWRKPIDTYLRAPKPACEHLGPISKSILATGGARADVRGRAGSGVTGNREPRDADLLLGCVAIGDSLLMGDRREPINGEPVASSRSAYLEAARAMALSAQCRSAHHCSEMVRRCVLCNKGTLHLGARGHQAALVRQWRGASRGEHRDRNCRSEADITSCLCSHQGESLLL